MKSNKDELDNEMLNIKNLIALIMADIDIFLLQDETQKKDLDKLYDKYEIREQLRKSAQKILNVLIKNGYDVSETLKCKTNIFFNQ